MATYDEYYEQARKQGISQAARLKKEREAADNETLSQIGRAIDKAADTEAGVYQKNIDGADAAYRSQYADSAVQEAFTREQIKNSMAASGMTDSGQNLTMQTAIGLQRGNRDAAITADKRTYVQKMQSAIDRIRANAEAQKQQQELSTRQATRNWYDNLLAGVETSAQDSAAKRYAADQKLEAKQYAADRELEAKKYAADLESQNALLEEEKKLQSKRADYVLKIISESGYVPGDEGYEDIKEKAWAEAYSAYPAASGLNGYSGSEMEIYNAAGGGEAGELAVAQNAVAVAASFVNGLEDLKKLGSAQFWNGRKAEDIIVTELPKMVSNNRKYLDMSQTQKSATLSMLAATFVCSETSDAPKSDLLRNVCSKLGVDYEDAEEAYKVLLKGR